MLYIFLCPHIYHPHTPKIQCSISDHYLNGYTRYIERVTWSAHNVKKKSSTKSDKKEKFLILGALKDEENKWQTCMNRIIKICSLTSQRSRKKSSWCFAFYCATTTWWYYNVVWFLLCMSLNYSSLCM